MNTLDVVLATFIITITLISNYDNFYNQIIRLLGIIISVFTSKMILQNVIIFLYPLIGYSKITKPILYYSTILSLYILLTIIFNIIVYRYQSAKKNRRLNLYGGTIISILNSVLIISIIMSTVFLSMQIDELTIKKLQQSKVFNYIYDIKINFIDYEK